MASIQNDSNVSCPICQSHVKLQLINSHLDAHTRADLPQQPHPALTQPTLQFLPNSNPKRPPPSTSSELEPQNKKRQPIVPAPSNPSLGRDRANSGSTPLAERVRPKDLHQFLGQPHLSGSGASLNLTKSLLQGGASFILWGPPGSGKTTLARCLSNSMGPACQVREISGTDFGASDWKKLLQEALGAQKLLKRRTLIFIDEAQRLNKAQQDLFLPYIESGQLTIILATTENPSFRLTAPLCSRCRLITLYPHRTEDVLAILERALRLESAQVDKTLIKWLSEAAEGDARIALTNLELIIQTQRTDPEIGVEQLKQLLGKKYLLYDRDGDNHYDLISALHKSVRGSDADAALYWLARMLEGGEDPLYVARRLVRMASEDIGLANPTALTQAVSAYQATQLIGMPECDCILAQVVVMLAESPKSVRTYKAYARAKAAVKSHPAYPVPLHIRNAPTKMMKDLGYGIEYKYEPDYGHPVFQTFLPTELEAKVPFLRPKGDAAGETRDGKLFDRGMLAEWETKKNAGKPWCGQGDGDQTT